MKRNFACNSLEHDLSRRQMLGTLAGTAAGTLGMGALLQPALAEKIKSQGKQVLFIWLDGGISQLESWDPKPNTEFGGPFRAIPTSVPGVHFSELVPETAKRMDKLAVIRSMCTKDPNHSTGVPRMQRGDPQNRGVTYPFIGSALAKLMPPVKNDLPPYMHIKPGRGGYMWKDAGFLGAKYGALALGDGKPPIHIHRPDSINNAVESARGNLRRKINNRFRQGRADSEVDAYEYSYQVAEKLMNRKELFDESLLPPKDIERYGTHPLGRHLLQARRLLEAGVQFVKVTSYHWDTHGDNFNMHLNLVPQIDRPFAAMIDDLNDRGMLDNVLVVLMSEFGRTPKINTRTGRDHWPEAWSMVLAGCGIQRGAVVGETTSNGAWVDSQPYDIGHLFHTIFHTMGIDAKETEYVNDDQPLPIAHDDCSKIAEVLS
ncbi:DUF1501 domain-containing protein [Bremerella alba]|uniref:DUF1501 domain-containing protein n=1 Tax=Bremerella alba TaxID=980252 RepID=A0A7V8V2G6_9BACT|nr:DUF1501 domain-containing protein [Bremerella alba]MBA2113576.1 hypothetical protein [Bremerella alba]